MTKKKILLIALFFLSFSIIAQKKFVGTITYKITYGKNTIDSSNLKLLPTELKVFVSKKYIKRESISKLGTTTIITDLKSGKSQILIDLTNEKKYIRDYTPDKKNDNRHYHKYQIVEKDSSKMILGEKCKYVKLESEKDTLYGFYSENFDYPKINISTPFTQVNYILLEYIEKSNFPITYRAVEIKREKLENEIFEVPEGFKRLLNL